LGRGASSGLARGAAGQGSREAGGLGRGTGDLARGVPDSLGRGLTGLAAGVKNTRNTHAHQHTRTHAQQVRTQGKN
jgi:hypothetical protein